MTHLPDRDPISMPRETGSFSTEIVKIGQPFKLFAPHRTTVTVPERDSEVYRGIPELESEIALDTSGLLPQLPIHISTGAIYKNRLQAFTPFNPQDGYQVTAEDFDGRARENKVSSNPDDRQDIKSSPLALMLSVDREISRALGILEGDYQFTPHSLDVLNRLRFRVMFPNGLRFESRPQFDIFNTGNLEFFGAFHPVDTRPLAVGYRGRPMEEGLQIALPANLEALQMIDGEFLLAPLAIEQKQE